MTIPNAPADISPPASIPASPAVPVLAPPSWPWRRAALFLVGAAQLITISALVGADTLAVTWWSLLLAIAPVPVAAAAAFAPAPVNTLAARGRRADSPRGYRGRDLAYWAVLCPGARGAGRRRRQDLA